MPEQCFDIVFHGETAPGIPREVVAGNLAQLFRTTPDTVARLLDGSTHTLKRGLDAAAAERYRSALERAGAVVTLQPAPAVPAPFASTRGFCGVCQRKAAGVIV